MPLNSADSQFKVSWPANTTPQAPDGSGASRATLAGVGITNVAAAARFVKVYDKASAPTVGTDAPRRTFQVAANSSLYQEFTRGKDFKLGLWVAVTTGGADSDNTAPAANDVLLTVDFQP